MSRNNSDLQKHMLFYCTDESCTVIKGGISTQEMLFVSPTGDEPTEFVIGTPVCAKHNLGCIYISFYMNHCWNVWPLTMEERGEARKQISSHLYFFFIFFFYL